MSEYTELLLFLKQQQDENKLSRFLEIKGYADPQSDDFGLNQWTSRLIPKFFDKTEQNLNTEIEQPEHLVSFLAIPDCWQEECIDTNSEEFQLWLSGYQWQHLPRVHHPFSQPNIQACSEGALLTKWEEISSKKNLEAFLLIRRDRICEYGLWKNAFFVYDKDNLFQFIQIIGYFWQFLIFIKDLNEKFFSQKNSEIQIIVNLRGTKNTLLGDLAEGWNEPSFYSLNSFRPKCPDKNLQYQRRISDGISMNNIDNIVHWFATRIDNAWGQFEPRCYVHKNIDEAQPFAARRSK